jgi:hypothetical protein
VQLLALGLRFVTPASSEIEDLFCVTGEREKGRYIKDFVGRSVALSRARQLLAVLEDPVDSQP